MLLLLSCCSVCPFVSVSSSGSAFLPPPRLACCGHSQPPLSASPEVAGVPAEEPLGAGPRFRPGRADWPLGLEAAGEQAALEKPPAGDAGWPPWTQTPRCALANAGSPSHLPLAARLVSPRKGGHGGCGLDLRLPGSVCVWGAAMSPATHCLFPLARSFCAGQRYPGCDLCYIFVQASLFLSTAYFFRCSKPPRDCLESGSLRA